MTEHLALHAQTIAVTRYRFDDGEAEGLVTRLRRHRSDAEQADLDGKTHEAIRHREQALAIYEDIETRLVPRFERYARGYFPDESQTQEDVIREMVHQLYTALFGDLDRSEYFTQNFNHAVRRRIIDAIRIVRVENDRNRETGKRNLLTVSLDSPQTDNQTEEESGILADVIADTHSTDAEDRILGEDLARSFLARLPSQKHRDIFRLRTEEFSWQEVSKTVGLPMRTAQHYYTQAKSILRKVAKRFIEETGS